MNVTDSIADMLTRIRNAVRVERPHIDMPFSKVKRGVRVRPVWNEKRIGAITDIKYFQPV